MKKHTPMNHNNFIVPHDRKIKLKDYDPEDTGEFHSKEEATEKLLEGKEKLTKLQDMLYASNMYGILIIFQAMDAAGKDSTIKHVMSGVNPQGCQVFSFKAPSAEEHDHDFMWRCMKSMPEKGRIGIFNRSYYEEVLVVRVHPEWLESQKLPPIKDFDKFWKTRFDDINNIEEYLTNNGIIILKFYLNINKEEQKKRFLKRIDTPEKNWKFSYNDVKEREHWDDYMKAYEETFNYTSTKYAPWYIIPANHKWYARSVVADIIISRMKELDLNYPKATEEHKIDLQKAKEILETGE